MILETKDRGASCIMTAMNTWSGKTVGKVLIENLIARGGMAEVYKGLHSTLDRPVAIKVMRNLLEEDPSLKSRFEREARVVAGLRHPNIVQVFDFDIADEQPYIIMEYINGPSLSAYLRGKNNSFTLPFIGRLLFMLGSALDYAHQQGVIHRDIKPANVLLQARSKTINIAENLPDDFEAILSDFGLLHITHSSTQTASGFVAGTPAYMSPEQARGEKVDARSDLYSLGVMLYEMLSGRVPFEADTTMGVLLKHIQEPPPPILDIPVSLQTVLLRALAKKPSDRYQSGRELTQAFLQASNLTLADVSNDYASSSAATIPGELNNRETLLPATQQTINAQPATQKWKIAALISMAIVIVGLIFFSFNTQNNQTALALTQTSQIIAATETAHHTDPMSLTVSGNAETIGLLRFYDVAAFLDEVILVTESLPAAPAGMQYEAWLLGTEARLSLGVLNPDPTGRAEITYLDNGGSNLLARYHRLEITLEPVPDSNPNSSGNVVYSSGIPDSPLEHMRHLFVSFADTPNQTGLIIGLSRDIQQLNELTQSMVESYQAGDAKAVSEQAETLHNLIVGSNGQGYGDLNGDGSIADQSDGYGLLFNGDHLGYIEGTISHTQYSMTMGGASQNINVHGVHVIDSAKNIEGWVTELRELLPQIIANPISEESNALIRKAAALADRIQRGRDLNGNEMIEPINGEGGLKTLLDHAAYMIDMPILAGINQVPPTVPANATPASSDDYYYYTPVP